MLSRFSYGKILENFESKTVKEGVEIIKVFPVYNLMLGVLKYKKNYDLSTHTAAAFYIERHGMGYLDKLPFGKDIQILILEKIKNLKDVYSH